MKYTLDYEKYSAKARQMIADGQVLLKNDKDTLPLKEGTTISLFGRMVRHYYKSGTGSGGMVNVNRVVSIFDALKEAEEAGKIKINDELVKIYEKLDEEYPYEAGIGWGQEPFSQKELPIDEAVVKEAASKSDVAVIVIGRLAGEDRDNEAAEGSYYLQKAELELIRKVTANFDKTVVVLNSGNIIDMSFVSEYNPEAVLYAWQGGMLGGYGTADVLLGKVNPSGKLTDTIAKRIEDYPSTANFGDPNKAVYAEDIFVGYRYFETFDKESVVYPFGFGLSYTSFEVKTESVIKDNDVIKVAATVKNTGNVAGREVVQVYTEAPQGVLGKPARVLSGFRKTPELKPGESCEVTIDIPVKNIASFDEENSVGLGTGFVIEKGDYNFYVGTDVRSAVLSGTVVFEDNILVEALKNALGPVEAFEKMVAVKDVGSDNGVRKEFKSATLRKDTMAARRLAELPENIEITGDKGYKLKDVASGKVAMKDFIAQLSKEELCIIIRGEGMSSPKVTPGTAAAFGGISKALHDKGIPVGCMDDGPSGMRLDSGIKAFALPNGTCLACSFDPEGNEELFTFLGIEMIKNKVDLLLGPGMNIHRNPLNGRNFEYFSEDPLLTGIMGAAQIKGLQANGATGVIKHFACNNQETGRQQVDPVVSERALREIYLRGFEIAVKAGADAVMTTYCRINKCWTSGNYDLNTTVLRNQWGFKGIVMTDWWAFISDESGVNTKTDFASMVKAQNDLYCCVPDADEIIGDNIAEELDKGNVTVGELQRTAANVCEFLIKRPCFLNEFDDKCEVEVVGADEGFDEIPKDIEYIEIGKEKKIDLSHLEKSQGYSYVTGIKVDEFGFYEYKVRGKGLPGSDLAQLPLTISYNATPTCSFNFRADGEWKEFKGYGYCYSKSGIVKLFFSIGGIEMDSLTITYVGNSIPEN